MKKIWVIMLFNNFCFGQIQTKLIPQSFYNSCWAATLAMAAVKIEKPMLSECEIIKKIMKLDTCNKVTVLPIEQDTLSVMLKNLYNLNDIFLSGKTIPANNLFEHLNKINKSLIYTYRFSLTSSHVVLMDSIFKVLNLNLIKIFDPWPKDKGTIYFMNYNKYKIQPGSRKSNGSQYGKFVIALENINLNRKKNEKVEKVNNPLPESIAGINMEKLKICTFLKSINIYKKNIDSNFLKETNLYIEDLEIKNSIPINPNKININKNDPLNINEKIYFLGEKNNDTIRTAITISYLKNCKKCNDKFILGKFENGKKYDELYRNYSGKDLKVVGIQYSLEAGEMQLIYKKLENKISEYGFLVKNKFQKIIYNKNK